MTPTGGNGRAERWDPARSDRVSVGPHTALPPHAREQTVASRREKDALLVLKII